MSDAAPAPQDAVPIPHSYWVIPGRFLAGEYPRTFGDAESRVKLQSILDAGITRFIDLTTNADRMTPYDTLLRELSGGRAKRSSLPITDQDVPRRAEEMRAILDCIDQALAAGENVMVHCWGGVGRTGTVVGCWLARHEPEKDAYLGLQDLWRNCPKSAKQESPENLKQCEFVKSWKET